MIKSIGHGPSQSPSFNAHTSGRPGVGGGQSQRPGELPTGGPDRAGGPHQGHRPENLGEVRELLKRVTQDIFENGGKGRPEGAPGASAQKPGGASGSPFEALGEEPGSAPLNLGQLFQQLQGPRNIEG